MSKANRITYRFDRNGNKIDEYGAQAQQENKWSVMSSKPAEQQPTEQAAGAAIAASREEQNIRASAMHEPTAPKPIHAVVHLNGAEGEEHEPGPPLYELDLEGLEQLIRNADSQPSVPDEDELLKQRYELDREDDWMLGAEAEAMSGAVAGTGHAMTEHAMTGYATTGHATTGHAMTGHADKQQHEAAWHKEQASEGWERARPSTRKSFTWMQGAVSVASAVASGVLIGYLLLTLVFGVSVWPMSAFAQPDQQNIADHAESGLPVEEQSLQSDEATPEAPDSGNQQPVQSASSGLKLSEHAFSYHLLQAGVFTKESTRDEVIASLQNAGFAAQYTKDSSNRYYVYAGLASSAANAEPVQAKIKGIETYRKAFTLAMPGTMAFNGEAAQLEQYFVQSNELIAMFADLASAQFEQTSFSAIGKAAHEAWQEKYEQWMSLAEMVAKQWAAPEDIERAESLQAQLKEAQTQLESYQAQPKSSYLWKAQSALVKAVLIQKDWFESANAL